MVLLEARHGSGDGAVGERGAEACIQVDDRHDQVLAASAMYNLCSTVVLDCRGVRLEGSHSLTEADRQRLAKAVLTEKPSSRNLQAPAAPGPERPPDLLSRAAQDAEISRFAAK